MHAVSGAGDGYVSAGIDQDASGWRVLTNRPHGGAGKRLQFVDGKVLFAQLNVIYAAAGGFGDLIEQRNPAGRFVAGKLPAVGDVVEEQRLL